MQNDAAEKIKQCTREKEIYKDLLLHIVNIDLIADELRYEVRLTCNLKLNSGFVSNVCK